jgi:hypothetical protein
VRTTNGTQISKIKIIVIPPNSAEFRGWFIRWNPPTSTAYAIRHAARIATRRKWCLMAYALLPESGQAWGNLYLAETLPDAAFGRVLHVLEKLEQQLIRCALLQTDSNYISHQINGLQAFIRVLFYNRVSPPEGFWPTKICVNGSPHLTAPAS